MMDKFIKMLLKYTNEYFITSYTLFIYGSFLYNKKYPIQLI